jgi:hypothetical protein
MLNSAILNQPWAAALFNHLWQSTVVTLIAWLLTLTLRNHQARTRYWVWMVASVKFLIPFSLLIAAGERLSTVLPTPIQKTAMGATMTQSMQLFTQLEWYTGADKVIATPVASHHPG